MKSSLIAALAATLCFACGKSDGGHTTSDLCAPSAVTLEVTTASNATCDPYRAIFVLRNGSCDPVTVSEVDITGTFLGASPCTSSGRSVYAPVVHTVAAKASATVQDIHADPYCCYSPGCTGPVSCGPEHYVFTATTSAGTLTYAQDVTITLGTCNPVCI